MFLTQRIHAIAKPVAIAVTLAIGALSLPSDAFAGHKRHGFYAGHHHGAYKHNRTYRHYNRGHRYHYRKRHRNNTGAAVAAGIIGLAVGAAIVNSNRSHHRSAPVRSYHGKPKPYSGAWYRYCANKYRSFDAASGTYLSYSGVRRVCR